MRFLTVQNMRQRGREHKHERSEDELQLARPPSCRWRGKRRRLRSSTDDRRRAKGADEHARRVEPSLQLAQLGPEGCAEVGGPEGGIVGEGVGQVARAAQLDGPAVEPLVVGELP